jgi:hypothetical protein
MTSVLRARFQYEKLRFKMSSMLRIGAPVWSATNEIMRHTGISKVTVWRWQERFTQAGVAVLFARQDAALAHPAAAGAPTRAHGGINAATRRAKPGIGRR